MTVAFGTVQVQYGGSTNTITTGSFTPSAGVAVATVGHTQSGITNTGVSSSVDGAFSSSGTRAANGPLIVTAWELQSLSNSSMTCSATFNDTYGTSAHLAVHPATGAHASSAFADYNTATGNSTTPSVTIANFSSGDGVVDCFHGGGGGTIAPSGNNVEEYEDQTGGNATAGSKNTTDGVMSWTVQFSGPWAQSGMRIVQAAAAGATLSNIVGSGGLVGNGSLIVGPGGLVG